MDNQSRLIYSAFTGYLYIYSAHDGSADSAHARFWDVPGFYPSSIQFRRISLR